MSKLDRLQIGISGIEQLIGTARDNVAQIENCEKQLTDVATIVNNFVLQTLQFVSDNDDVASVNETLASSLIQIKNFVDERPQRWSEALSNAENRLGAYEQCKIVLLEAQSLEDKSGKEEPEEPEITEPEANVATPVGPYEEQTVREETRERIIENIDEDGQYSKRRKIAERPEKLRDIRNVQKELESSNIFQEDN